MNAVDSIIASAQEGACSIAGMPSFICKYGIIASGLTGYGIVELARAQSRVDQAVGVAFIAGGYWVHNYSVGKVLNRVNERLGNVAEDVLIYELVPEGDRKVTTEIFDQIKNRKGGGLTGLVAGLADPTNTHGGYFDLPWTSGSRRRSTSTLTRAKVEIKNDVKAYHPLVAGDQPSSTTCDCSDPIDRQLMECGC